MVLIAVLSLHKFPAKNGVNLGVGSIATYAVNAVAKFGSFVLSCQLRLEAGIDCVIELADSPTKINARYDTVSGLSDAYSYNIARHTHSIKVSINGADTPRA